MTKLTSWAIRTKSIFKKLFTRFCFVVWTHFSIPNIICTMGKCTLYIKKFKYFAYVFTIFTKTVYFPIMTYFGLPLCLEIVGIPRTSFWFRIFFLPTLCWVVSQPAVIFVIKVCWDDWFFILSLVRVAGLNVLTFSIFVRKGFYLRVLK